MSAKPTSSDFLFLFLHGMPFGAQLSPLYELGAGCVAGMWLVMLIWTADKDVLDIASYMLILCTVHVHSTKNHTDHVYSHVFTCVLSFDVIFSLQCKALVISEPFADQTPVFPPLPNKDIAIPNCSNCNLEISTETFLTCYPQILF